MPRETICVYCEKPLLDVDHAKKHVLEQCPKAPWRARLAGLEQTNIRLQAALDDAERGRRGQSEHYALTKGKLEAAEALNTPLRERVAALEQQLSEGRGLLGELTDRNKSVFHSSGCKLSQYQPTPCPGAPCWLWRVRTHLGHTSAVDGTTSDNTAIRPLDPAKVEAALRDLTALLSDAMERRSLNSLALEPVLTKALGVLEGKS